MASASQNAVSIKWYSLNPQKKLKPIFQKPQQGEIKCSKFHFPILYIRYPIHHHKSTTWQQHQIELRAIPSSKYSTFVTFTDPVIHDGRKWRWNWDSNWIRGMFYPLGQHTRCNTYTTFINSRLFCKSSSERIWIFATWPTQSRSITRQSLRSSEKKGIVWERQNVVY